MDLVKNQFDPKKPTKYSPQTARAQIRTLRTMERHPNGEFLSTVADTLELAAVELTEVEHRVAESDRNVMAAKAEAEGARRMYDEAQGSEQKLGNALRVLRAVLANPKDKAARDEGRGLMKEFGVVLPGDKPAAAAPAPAGDDEPPITAAEARKRRQASKAT